MNEYFVYGPDRHLLATGNNEKLLRGYAEFIGGTFVGGEEEVETRMDTLLDRIEWLTSDTKCR